MTYETQIDANTPAELGFASLDLVVGGGGLMIERRLFADTTDVRKQGQEQEDYHG
jgi:hypothetical protein